MQVLGTGETFLYGCLGGFIAFTAIFAIPELRKTYAERNFVMPSEGQLFVIGLLFILQIAFSGAVAAWLGDATLAKQAISYGVGAEGIVGGLLRASS